MRIVSVLFEGYNGHSDVLGVYEDINDAIEMMGRFEKKYPRQHPCEKRFWLEDIDVIPKGGLTPE